MALVITVYSNYASAAAEIGASGTGNTENEALFNAKLNTIKKALSIEMGESSHNEDILQKLAKDYKNDENSFIETCNSGQIKKTQDNKYAVKVKCMVDTESVVSYYKRKVENISTTQSEDVDAITDNKRIYVRPTCGEYTPIIKNSFTSEGGYTVVSAPNEADYELYIDKIKCWQEDMQDNMGRFIAGCSGAITITKVRGGGRNIKREVTAYSECTHSSKFEKGVLNGAQRTLFANLQQKISAEILRTWSYKNHLQDNGVNITVDEVSNIDLCRQFKKIIKDISESGISWIMHYDGTSRLCNFDTESYPGDISTLISDIKNQANKEFGKLYNISSNKE